VILRQQLYELVVGNEVTSNHGEDETAVVTYIFTAIQRVEHVTHHRTLAQIFYRNELISSHH
jgi:hypothetical protein